MNVPQEIRCQVIRLYIDGKSEDEMINLMGVSKDQVENVLSDLDSPDGQNILTYVLALNYGKDGLDMNEYVDLTQAKKKLVQQGVLPKNALPFVTNVAEFTETTGLGADVFVPAYSIYQKLASMRIRNYQDLQKRKYQSLLALESYRKELKELQERYRLLAKVSVGKEISETRWKYYLTKYKRVTPHSRDQVVNLYCNSGISMRDIADKLGFSKTKVYDILHDANTSDNELFLRHNLVSNLNKAGITIREYADLVRSKNILVRRGIQTAKVLEIISKVIELCFRINLEPQLLASSFDNFSQFVSSIASKFGEDLQRRLEFELKYMENVLNDLDIVLDKCKQLRTQIDILERLASYQSNSMGKHSWYWTIDNRLCSLIPTTSIQNALPPWTYNMDENL